MRTIAFAVIAALVALPALADEPTWNAEDSKFIKACGAPIGDADAKDIAAYLAANYGT
jgi:hypothetical protein